MNKKYDEQSFEKTVHIIKERLYQIIPPISQIEIEMTNFIPNFLNELPNPIYQGNNEHTDINDNIIEWKLNYLFDHFKNDIIAYYKQLRKSKVYDFELDCISLLAEVLCWKIYDSTLPVNLSVGF